MIIIHKILFSISNIDLFFIDEPLLLGVENSTISNNNNSFDDLGSQDLDLFKKSSKKKPSTSTSTTTSTSTSTSIENAEPKGATSIEKSEGKRYSHKVND